MNEYIELYEHHKDEGHSTIDSLLFTLNTLKQDRENWINQNKLGYFGIGIRFDKNPFFQPKITQKNIAIIGTVIDQLHALKANPDYQQARETATTRLELLKILGDQFHELSKKGETQQLFNYVIKEEGSIDFSMRESSLVTPSPVDILTEKEEPYVDEQTWVSLPVQELLESKGILVNWFDPAERSLTLEHDLHEHVQWAYSHVYQYAYRISYEETAIARFHHGIQHVTRAANYARVFANLYRKYGDEEAQHLSENDIKLIQIALLFHDSAREGDNEDLWDHESAILLYCYLTRVLHVDSQTAKQVAEATANKDPSPEKGYFELNEDKDGQLSWQFSQFEGGGFPKKTIYQKIIHDCDCLDIIRARNQYDANYLDFYKDIASHNELALEEMAELIIEARGLIHHQGDSYITKDEDSKLEYENGEAHARIVTDMESGPYPILQALHKRLLSIEELQALTLVDLTPFDETAPMTEQNLAAALREGRILARGVTTPSALPKRKANKPILPDETLAEKEIRKSMRADGINSKSRKEPPNPKDKNPLRSTSILGYGSGVYPAAGLLIFNPNLQQIRRVSIEDFDSGRGQKAHLAHLQEKEYSESREVLGQELYELHQKMKLGLFGKKNQQGSNYVEILYDIDRYDAIFFTNDPTIGNYIAYDDFNPAHRFSPILQAIYLQKEYERQYEATRAAYGERYGEEGDALFLERFGPNPRLPVYDYSGLHNRLVPCDPTVLTDENIVNMWVAMCSDYMRDSLLRLDEDTSHAVDDSFFYALSVEDIKVYSMYKYKVNTLAQKNQPGDLSYDESLKKQVTHAIEKARENIVAEYEQSLLEQLQGNQLSALSTTGFLVLQYSPHLREQAADKIKTDLVDFVHSGELDACQLDGVILPDVPVSTLDIPHCHAKARNAFCKSKLIKAFILCQQAGLDNEVQRIRNKLGQWAEQLLSNNAPGESELNKRLKLRQLMMLMDPENPLLPAINASVQALVSQLTTQYLSKKSGLQSSYLLIKTLNAAGFPRSQYQDDFRVVYDKVNETLPQLHPSDWTYYVSVIKLLRENPGPVIERWIVQYEDKIYNGDALLESFHNLHFTFNDENLELFSVLVQKLHYNQEPRWYVQLPYWFRLVKGLQHLCENHQFSESQLKILNDRLCEIVGKVIEEEEAMGSLYYSEEQKAYHKVTSYAQEINTILKANDLPVPDSLINQFNAALTALEQCDLNKIQFDKARIFLVKAVHNQLPRPEERAHVLEKIADFMSSKAQDEKEAIKPSSAAGF
ncbi:SidE phosphodiesterase domain-containing protein [Legionella sp. MW5194]|uniref:SidE phosphodiesterase domain-containing protein n=1 Tax=Legionella sp. MW5194 TaxID=2662448 RepID=UPI00272CBEC5|nr:SidE phosphodiesterase domain-containing protein [Legionella sp. MW5194]